MSTDSYTKLQEKFNEFQQALQKREQTKQQNKRKKQNEKNDLLQTIQQKTDSIISKLQQLKRKQTIIITVHKIQPSIPENFPKNYFLQFTYEDVVITGNQKFTDFDENVIEEKFIIPLLTSSKAKVEVWTAEEEPVLFDKLQIELQKIIEECLMNGDKCDDEMFLNQCPDHKLTFKVQLQGIGFSSWLKNLNLLRQMQIEKQIMRQEERKRREQVRAKIEEKKKSFNKKFPLKKIQETKQYGNQGIDSILDILADD